jgi:hypothetical protein
MCFTLRLHTSAAPPRVGLTQALGGTNPYAVHRDRLARRSGHFRPAAVFNDCAHYGRRLCIASVSSLGALTHRLRYVGRLRKRCLVSISVLLLMLSFRKGPAESPRVRVPAFPLRFSVSAPGFDLHGRPPAT